VEKRKRPLKKTKDENRDVQCVNLSLVLKEFIRVQLQKKGNIDIIVLGREFLHFNKFYSFT